MEGGRAEHVLVIGADLLSRFIDGSDRGTAALFADGAGAAVVSPANGGGGWIGDVVLHCDGLGGPAIRATHEEQRIRMQGHDTFKAAVHRMSESTLEAAERAGVPLDEIDLFVYHQANIRILRAVAERLEHRRVARGRLHRPLRQHVVGHAPDSAGRRAASAACSRAATPFCSPPSAPASPGVRG